MDNYLDTHKFIAGAMKEENQKAKYTIQDCKNHVQHQVLFVGCEGSQHVTDKANANPQDQ